MILPETLSPADVEDVLAEVGLRMDRRNVARALHRVRIEGVVAPARSGVRWRIPRAALPQVIAACLWRHAWRALAPHGGEPGSPADHLGEALGRMATRPWLAALVPAELQPVLRRQQRAALRRRREREREERERQASWDRQRQAEAEARRRAREEEARCFEELQRKREREEDERLLREAYSICFRAAYRAIGSPKGPRWPELPEARQLRRDFPHERPAWWLPPPGLLEAVKAQGTTSASPGQQEPDWGRWVPPYVPGRPWPWRKGDVGHLGHADCA